jgi:hypothetical protein
VRSFRSPSQGPYSTRTGSQSGPGRGYRNHSGFADSTPVRPRSHVLVKVVAQRLRVERACGYSVVKVQNQKFFGVMQLTPFQMEFFLGRRGDLLFKCVTPKGISNRYDA